MTIQEAIKSGKPFRRKAWAKKYPDEWYVRTESKGRKWTWWIGEIMVGLTELGAKSFTKDILADDWEIKQ